MTSWRGAVPELWHYTCGHGAEVIGVSGEVVPMAMHAPEAAARMPEEYRWMSELSWFTDQAQPDAIDLGLTKATIRCDRTEFRYRVTDASNITRWLEVVRDYPRNTWILTQGDHRPGLWWVSRVPVPVVLAQRRQL